MNAVAIAEPQTNLRAEFVERIKGYWHKSRANILALGRTLTEARQQLSPSEFAAMVEQDLPFGVENARRFMRVAADPKLSATSQNSVPESVEALDNLRRLTDEQFEHAIATGRVHERMTVAESRQIVRDVIHVASKPHRPAAALAQEAPRLPESGIARSYAELVGLMRAHRHTLGISHLAFDDRIGWTQGQTGKYEIPHKDDGRVADWKNFFEWCSGLGVGLKLVPLSDAKASLPTLSTSVTVVLPIVGP